MTDTPNWPTLPQPQPQRSDEDTVRHGDLDTSLDRDLRALARRLGVLPDPPPTDRAPLLRAIRAEAYRRGWLPVRVCTTHGQLAPCPDPRGNECSVSDLPSDVRRVQAALRLRRSTTPPGAPPAR